MLFRSFAHLQPALRFSISGCSFGTQHERLSVRRAVLGLRTCIGLAVPGRPIGPWSRRRARGRCQRQPHRQPPPPTPTSPTISSPDPSPIPSPDPPTTPSPDPEPETVEVPELTYTTRAEAKQVLANLGLKATTKYKFTDQDPAGTVISQSPKAGARVLPDTTVSLVVAKTPPAPAPPPPSTAPRPPPTDPPQTCDPSYPNVCPDHAVGDYDCAGGTGNGPGYVEGPIRVLPPDPFGLDGNGDGWGCENG